MLAQDVERLAHCTYPRAPESFRATIVCDQFIDALQDDDMQVAEDRDTLKTSNKRWLLLWSMNRSSGQRRLGRHMQREKLKSGIPDSNNRIMI